MNILYLANHLNTGGISRYLLGLCTGLQNRGHNIYLASGGGELEAEFTRAGVACLRLPLATKCEVSPGVFYSLFKLLPVIKKQHIQIIHCNTRVTQVLGCLLARQGRVVCVSTCHGFFKPRLSRRIFPCWGKKTIAISQQVAGHLVEDLGAKKNNVLIIHHGIQYSAPRAMAQEKTRQEFGLGRGPVIGIIARLSDVKGHIYLVEAMQKVLERFPSAQLFIVGDGPMKKELMEQVRRLGIERSVRFTPQVRDTAAALAAMDIFVLPSLKEGLGLALMEAMAAGLAVIGSDIGGIKTLIRDGQNGLLVTPQDSGQLAQKILALLQDGALTKRLGDNAREMISKEFSYEKMLDKTEEVYRLCLGQKN